MLHGNASGETTVTKIIWEQAAILLVRNRTVLTLALFFAYQTRLLAVSGFADMPATRACWLRPPYALSKCYSWSGGPYHADLFLGQPSQSGDMWHYDGIVPQPLLVASNISRVAVTSRSIIVEYAGSEPSFGVINTQRIVLEPVRLESLAGVRQYLEQQGEKNEVIRFQDFEDIYRERSSWWRVYKTESVSLLLVLALGFLSAWRYRRKRGSAFRGRLLGMGLPFLLAFLLDWSLTLHGQSAEYWAGNYACANETSPFFRALFMIHPLAAIAGQLVWVGLILTLLVLLPEILAVILLIFVVFGHMMGAYSWMILAMTAGRYQFGMVTNLVTAILLGVALYRSQHATVQNESSAGTLPTWLRYGLITLLSCTALVIVLAPW